MLEVAGLGGERFAQRNDCGLGGVIGRHVGGSGKSGCARDIENDSGACAPHERKRRSASPNDAQEVCVDDPAPVIGRGRLERSRNGDACVVDHHIKTAEAFCKVGNGCRDEGLRSDRADVMRNEPGSRRLEFGAGGFDALAGDVEDAETPARTSKLEGQCTSKAAGRAGDEGALCREARGQPCCRIGVVHRRALPKIRGLGKACI